MRIIRLDVANLLNEDSFAKRNEQLANEVVRRPIRPDFYKSALAAKGVPSTFHPARLYGDMFIADEAERTGHLMSKLQEAVTIVTGAGRGIGRAIAEELGRGGATVVINYAKSKTHAEELVAQLSEQGARAIAVQADVSDAAQAKRLIEETVQHFGRIDALVNNAGINIDRTLKKLTIEDWDKVLQVDLSSYFYTLKAALPYFTGQRSGAIINISSFVGQAGNFGQANYSAAKAGIIGLTRTSALELARYNVTVNAICPGFIETDMYTSVPEKVQEQILKRIPLGRVGTAHEIARGVRYLIEDGAYITGQTLNINGGIYM